jgi:hypothetical protein
MNRLENQLNLYSAIVDKPGHFSDFQKYDEGLQDDLFAFLQPLIPK